MGANGIPLFELDALKRDWIDGVPGSVFWRQVRTCIARVEAIIDLANEQGVLITHSDPIEFAAAFLASVHSGVPTILASPNWQQSEWEQLQQQVNPAIVFGTSGISDAKASTPYKLQPGTILIPTGGSSGKLKLAVHTWGTLSAACEGFQSLVGTSDYSCCVLPLYHVSGLMQLIRSFVAEGRIAFTNYRLLQSGQIPAIAPRNLCLSLVPTQLSRLIEKASTVNWLRSLKAIFLGGAPITKPLQTQARALCLPVVPTYGMTETAAMITALPVDDFLSGKSGVGYALKHAGVQIIREDGSLCLPGETGRIRIQTRSLCLGYHGTPSDDFGSVYLSQDEGYLDQEGCLHVVGRSDRIIISGGEKIDPLEIETAFLDTGMVDQVFAIGWPEEEWGEQLVVFCVSSSPIEEIGMLRRKLKDKLVNYKIPQKIILVDHLPLTIQGKPNHVLIRDLLRNKRPV